jgi:hypothetical protein
MFRLLILSAALHALLLSRRRRRMRILLVFGMVFLLTDTIFLSHLSLQSRLNRGLAVCD